MVGKVVVTAAAETISVVLAETPRRVVVLAGAVTVMVSLTTKVAKALQREEGGNVSLFLPLSSSSFFPSRGMASIDASLDWIGTYKVVVASAVVEGTTVEVMSSSQVSEDVEEELTTSTATPRSAWF